MSVSEVRGLMRPDKGTAIINGKAYRDRYTQTSGAARLAAVAILIAVAAARTAVARDVT